MERSLELEELTRQLVVSFVEGDADAFAGLVDSGDQVLFIGSDPKEWWHGADHVVGAIRTQLAEMKGHVNLVPTEVVAASEGDAGWSAMNGLFSADGAESPFRISLVFLRRADGWKIAHGHFSAAVANEEVVGRELTV